LALPATCIAEFKSGVLLRGGWGKNVAHGWARCLLGVALRKGDETGWGMNEGVVPPRLEGGVNMALAGLGL